MRNIMYRALKLGTGTILAQIISLVSIPIISRIYNPAEYGHLTLILSVTAILIPVATFRIETLIVVSDTDEEAAKLLSISANLALVVSAILFAITFTKYFIFENSSFTHALITSFLFAMVLMAQSIGVLLVQVALRAHKDSDIARSSVIQNLSISFAQVVTGIWSPSGSALISSYVAGRIVGISPLWRETRKILSKRGGDFRRTLEKYMAQLKASSPLVFASVIDSAILGLPIILISTQFGLQYSGYIGITQTILTVPITLVGGAFGSVILSELSSNIRDNQDSTHRNATIIRTFSKYLFYFSITFAIVTLLFGSAIFNLIFNDNWLEASRLVGYLAVPFGVSLLWQPLMSVYFASQQWNKYLIISISRLVLSTSAAALAIILEFDWIHVTFAFFIGNSIVQIYSVKDVLKVLKNLAKD
jgi:O-antigen/teichoic acid export membrane protein